MKLRITHIAWDYGAIDSAMHSVLGDIADVAKSKTTKTLCDRRVDSSLIDNDNPICQKCVEEKREAERMERKMATLAINYGTTSLKRRDDDGPTG